MSDLQKYLEKFNGGSRAYISDEEPELLVQPTGVTSLDLATKLGGFPMGRQIEIFGRESCGKSALTYYMMHSYHKAGYNCAYLDIEGSWSPKWVQKCIPDFDFKKVAIFEPNPGEEAVEWLINHIQSGVFGLTVFDSVGAMVGEAEQDADSKARVGGQSKLVTDMVKKVRAPAKENNCTVVYINQIRDFIGGRFAFEVAPGGHGIKHMTVIRIHLKSTKLDAAEKAGGDQGFKVSADIVKNKTAAPLGVASWKFLNESAEGIYGIDLYQDFIDSAINLRLIRQDRAMYYHPAFDSLRGKKNVIDFFKANPNKEEEVRKEMIKVLREDFNLTDKGPNDNQS